MHATACIYSSKLKLFNSSKSRNSASVILNALAILCSHTMPGLLVVPDIILAIVDCFTLPSLASLLIV